MEVMPLTLITLDEPVDTHVPDVQDRVLTVNELGIVTRR